MKVTVGYDVILTSVIDTKQDCLNLGISIDWLMMDMVPGWLKEGVLSVFELTRAEGENAAA